MQNFRESNEIAYIVVTLSVRGMLSNRCEIIVFTVAENAPTRTLTITFTLD